MSKLYAQFNYIGEIELTEDQARQGYHQGECYYDILDLMTENHINQQLRNINPEDLKKELKEYGAWDDEELRDHGENLARILWIACGDITEDLD